MKKTTDGLLILLILITLFIKETKAYLDPGSASYLLQILLAGLFSVLLAVKTFWKRIVLIVERIFGQKSEESKKNEKSKSS
jgi:predicted membrane protein